MRKTPHPDSDNLGRLAWGCFWSALITATIALAVIAGCRSLAAQALRQAQWTAVYLPIVTMPESRIGIAWFAGTAQDLQTLQAHYWYACCSICPPPGDARIPILRPGTWWADCPADYDGHILVGNEGEDCGQQDCLTPAQMAAFILAARTDLPEAIFVCLNSYSIAYMLDVIALLPSGTCEIWGVHTPIGLADVSGHLDGLCADCRVWITEMSNLNNQPDSYEVMHSQTYQALADTRVERIFIYTAVGGTPASLDAIKPDGSLYPNGLAFKNAHQGYP